MKTPGGTRSGIPVAGGATPSPAGNDFADWAERMQRARGRHAAITRNLYSWSSYKSWAERVKSGWDGEEEK